MSNEPLPPPPPPAELPPAPYTPPAAFTQPPPLAPPRKPNMKLIAGLGAVVGLIVVRMLFSSGSATTTSTLSGPVAVTRASAADASDDPLVGTWTMVPPGDTSCTQQAVFSHNAQGLHMYSGLNNGVANYTTGYAQQGSSINIGDQNPYGFNSFKILSPTRITKTWCSSMACSSCDYTKD